MKALLLHRDLAFDGGVGQCFLQFARNYDSSQLDLIVGGLEDVGPGLTESLRVLDVPSICLDGGAYAGQALRLRRIIQREGIDVIAATSLRAYVIAKAAAIRLRCRVLFWIHSIPLVIEGAFRQAVFRLVAKSDTLVFVSNAVRDVHKFEAHTGKSLVVHNGVEDHDGVDEIQPYARERRADLGIAADTLVVGCIAEFVGRKNHHILVEAFAELTRSRPEARLLLIGDGELRSATLDLAAQLGISDRVIAPGRRRDARRLLGVMDIYAHPANGEGFGLAVAESMLASLPTVGARAGAVVELIEHDENGLLVEPDDVRSLSDALTRLAADSELRASLGAEARAHCLKRFSPACYAGNLTRALIAEYNVQTRTEPVMATR